MEKKLNWPGTIGFDFDKLAVGGHSFGGMTAIGIAITDERVKVCLPMDPWFFPYQEDE